MTVVNPFTQSCLLLNNFNPAVDFPLRYFDLTSTCTIGETRLGEKCTVIATVSDIEDQSIFVTDETGGMFLKLYNAEYYDDFEVGDEVIFSGVVEDYDFQKCIKNPLVIKYVEGKYSEVMPVYPFDFTINRTDIEDETLLAIHGFSTKADLIKARRALQLKQLNNCLSKLQNSTLEQELLKSYPETTSFNKKVRLITRFDEGEEAQAIKDVKNSLVICPLAYMPSEARNSKVYGYERFSKVPESKPHPNISIEIDADCAGNSDGVKRRGKVLSQLLHADVLTAATCAESADLIVVEDANRISTLEIDYWMRRSQSDFLLVSNSKQNMQLSRLKFLCEPHTQSEVLWHELKFRRDGDILGCRNPLFKSLSLVNLANMKAKVFLNFFLKEI